MEWILTELIGSAITSGNNLVDLILESLVPTAFYIEKSIGAGVNFAEMSRLTGLRNQGAKSGICSPQKTLAMVCDTKSTIPSVLIEAASWTVRLMSL